MPLRLIFMGTPDFAVPTLLELAGRHDFAAVYTRAPKPAGRRGLELTPSPVEREARRLGLPVLTLSLHERAGGAQLFSEGVHDEMWSPQTIIKTRGGGPYNTHFASYGLGWGLSDVKGMKQCTHTGGLAGIVTQITLIPEMKLGIIVLTNQQSGAAFNAITNTIKDSYLGVTGQDRLQQMIDRVQKGEADAKKITSEIWSKIAAQQKLDLQSCKNSNGKTLYELYKVESVKP